MCMIMIKSSQVIVQQYFFAFGFSLPTPPTIIIIIIEGKSSATLLRNVKSRTCQLPIDIGLVMSFQHDRIFFLVVAAKKTGYFPLSHVHLPVNRLRWKKREEKSLTTSMRMLKIVKNRKIPHITANIFKLNVDSPGTISRVVDSIRYLALNETSLHWFTVLEVTKNYTDPYRGAHTTHKK